VPDPTVPPARLSLRKAVNSFCKHCIYDRGAPGNWRQQVDACTAQKCPLFAVRPRSEAPFRVLAGGRR